MRSGGGCDTLRGTVRAVREVEKMSMNTKKNVSIGLLALAMLLWALRKLNVL